MCALIMGRLLVILLEMFGCEYFTFCRQGWSMKLDVLVEISFSDYLNLDLLLK